MTEPQQSASSDAIDPLVSRVGQTSLRMMAGVVPRDVVEHLQARLYAEPDEYPWEEVLDTVLDDSVSDSDLVNKGILAHRNWLLRSGGAVAAAGPSAVSGGSGGASVSSGGGRGPRRAPPSMKVRGKTLLAAMIVKGGFFLIYTFAVILLLIVLRQRFEWFDIYRVLEWLREALPSVFSR